MAVRTPKRIAEDPIHGDSGGTNSMANGSESEFESEKKALQMSEEAEESEESYDSEEERQHCKYLN